MIVLFLLENYVTYPKFGMVGQQMLFIHLGGDSAQLRKILIEKLKIFRRCFSSDS